MSLEIILVEGVRVADLEVNLDHPLHPVKRPLRLRPLLQVARKRLSQNRQHHLHLLVLEKALV
tara:strand:- start:1778 stop:1966 length:189 start_codon:yes stop_codon:yes gene_type:complete